MANEVLRQDEVLLNGNRFKIKGPVVGTFQDPFPQQQSIGDPSYNNQLELSAWITDFSKGIGVEEMNEKIDTGSLWWTNCITDYWKHILLPRKSTSIALPTIAAPSPLTKTGETVTQGTTSSTSIDNWTNNYRNMLFTFTCDVTTVVAGSKITLSDGIGTSNSNTHSGGGDAETLTVTRRLDTAATSLTMSFVAAAGGSNTTFGTGTITIYPTMDTTPMFANFNGSLYAASGNVVIKLASNRASFSCVGSCGATITAIIPSLNSRLYLYQGDATNYWYMSTAEVFTQSNSANANWGFQTDAKLFKVDTAGTVKYSTDPDAGGPTWTAGGAITDIASQIQGFLIGRDASGSTVPYAVTKSILKGYDDLTPQWVDTEVNLGNHPNGGKGFTYWNGKMYFSYGLAVKEYDASTGALRDIGLTERDGLPVEYNGEITKLYDGADNGLFASVDSSQVSGTNKSGLYLWTGAGWRCWWVDTSNDGAMSDIIISSASSAYAVYWDVAGVVYYIDIPRGVKNPSKISQTYNTSGILLSPWFDADNQSAGKLAKSTDCYINSNRVTETIRPSAAGDEENIPTATSGAGLHYQDVGEVVESTSTSVAGATGDSSWYRDLYNLGNLTITPTTVISVTIHADVTTFSSTPEQTTLKLCLKTNGTAYEGTEQTTANGLAMYSETWLLNPNTGVAWTVSDINALQAGLSLRNGKITPITSGTQICTWLYVNVVYAQSTVVKYRLDHTYTDLDTGWTTLDTITSNGSTKTLFGSGAGVAFKAIQFRHDLASGDATQSPDIQSFVFNYKKRPGSEKIRVWTMTVLVDHYANGGASNMTPPQKVTNLNAAITSDTDVVFSYKPNAASTETAYVQVDCLQFRQQTGTDYQGEYDLRLVEVG